MTKLERILAYIFAYIAWRTIGYRRARGHEWIIAYVVVYVAVAIRVCFLAAGVVVGMSMMRGCCG